MIGQAERILELKRLKGADLFPSGGKVFAFTSGKGGTGKTFLSLNVAYSLVKKNKKVLVVDLDANFSNGSIMLNMFASKTIYKFYTGHSLLNELITEVEPGFHFIFGDSGKTDYSSPGIEMIKYFYSQLRNLQDKYDFIFIDTGVGAADDTLSFLLRADVNIIVTTPEPTAVMDAYVMLKLLKQKGYGGKKYLLVNRCLTPNDVMQTHNNFNTAAKHFLNDYAELLGSVDSHEAVSQSIINQELLVKHFPEGKTALQISNLSSSLIEIAQMANIRQTL